MPSPICWLASGTPYRVVSCGHRTWPFEQETQEESKYSAVAMGHTQTGVESQILTPSCEPNIQEEDRLVESAAEVAPFLSKSLMVLGDLGKL